MIGLIQTIVMGLLRSIAGVFISGTTAVFRLVGGATSFQFQTSGGSGLVTIDSSGNLTAESNITATHLKATGSLFLSGTDDGSASSSRRLIVTKTAIADNSATAVLTVTVPNANHAAAIRITFLSSNGGADAFESSRVAEGLIVVARTTGVATVAVAAALSGATIATVSSGATHTLAYAVSAITGADSATQTFTVDVTIDDSGNLGANQLHALVDILNSEASGVSVAAA